MTENTTIEIGTILSARTHEGMVLTTKVGLPHEAAARALLEFRELRQGSRKTVFPT